MNVIDDFLEISNKLTAHHSIFSMMWQLGRPTLTTQIESAAVAWNAEGGCIDFMFNPDFAARCTMNDICFVIGHETFHVILEHGKRMKGLHKEASNYAADITINEMLKNQFGFELSDWLNEWLCTRDSVFGPNHKVQGGREFEYYYQILMKNAVVMQRIVKSGSGEGSGSGPKPLDDHSYLPVDIPSELQDMIEKMSHEEAKTLQEALAKDNPGDVKGGSGRGEGTAFKWVQATLKPKAKEDWRKVIQNWTIKQYREKKKTQWRLDRRFVSVQRACPDLIIPSVGPADSRFGHMIDMTFFMDVSGSCHGQSQAFFAAAKTIPMDKFIIDAYAFDTGLMPIDLEDTKLPYGGGTSFNQLEDHCRRLPSYPSCVFVLTDGMGTPVQPLHPDRWHIFLTMDYKRCFPADVNFYDFTDFNAYA